MTIAAEGDSVKRAANAGAVFSHRAGAAAARPSKGSISQPAAGDKRRY